MRLFSVAILVLIFGSTVQAEEKKKTFELPEEPLAVVLTMEYAGGFTPPRTSQEPWLTVRANGTVEMPDRFGQGPDFATKVSQEEIQALLHEVVTKPKLLEIDQETLAKKYKEAMNPKPGPDGKQVFVPRVADAPNTEITVHLNGKVHKLSQYALGLYADQFKVDEMQRMNQAAKAIQRFSNVARAGGKDAVAKCLKAINAEVAKQNANAPKLTAENLSYTNLKADGTVVVNFMKNGGPENRRNYVRGAVTKDGETMKVDVAVKWE